MFYSDGMINNKHTATFTSSPADLRKRHRDALDTVAMTIRHPRSLARGTASWRPPTIGMAPEPGQPALNITITRHRVGATARARIRGYGETRTPAYLVTLRLTSPDVRRISHHEADTWITAILPDTGTYNVHRIDGLGAPTYCWIIDQHFQPLESPASLFQSERVA